jgi:hypothetical protein
MATWVSRLTKYDVLFSQSTICLLRRRQSLQRHTLEPFLVRQIYRPSASSRSGFAPQTRPGVNCRSWWGLRTLIKISSSDNVGTGIVVIFNVCSSAITSAFCCFGTAIVEARDGRARDYIGLERITDQSSFISAVHSRSSPQFLPVGETISFIFNELRSA